jgi:hypothetical protein
MRRIPILVATVVALAAAPEALAATVKVSITRAWFVPQAVIVGPATP